MKKLLCISERFADTAEWANEMRIPRCNVKHYSPYTNPNMARGLSEDRTAIVWINHPRLSELHRLILGTYIGMGVPSFEGHEREKIRAWLHGDKPYLERLGDRIRAVLEWQRSG